MASPAFSNDGEREPLLVGEGERAQENDDKLRTGLPSTNKFRTLAIVGIRTGTQTILLGLMWVLLLLWIGLFILWPTQFFRQQVTHKLSQMFSSSFYRITEYPVIFYSAPLFLIAILATVYLQVRSQTFSNSKGFSSSEVLSSTTPAIANGFLGIISVAELISMLLFLLYVVWLFWSYLSQDFSSISLFNPPAQRWRFELAIVGLRAGIIGLIVLGFLFLPVSRGSVLLRLLDLPFEHAVKYHIWLGHLMMAIFTAHGLCFVILWALEGRLISELVSWSNFGVANLPGVISLLAGWAMWVTSLPPVRQHFFELFFYTHQLYAVFLIFMALHIGDFLLGLAIAGIFFFLVDRFLRFCQSRKAVTLLSARILPCGAIEMVLAKPPSLKYHSLSFIFLNIPKISWLQWHPFSVSSSPHDGSNHLAILIKPLGQWTNELKAAVRAFGTRRNGFPLLFSVGIEGPYGHESDYYLRYNKLILVAGGIGVSPFVAILRDIFHRYQKLESNLPKDVLLIWAVKKSKELHILDLVNPTCICSEYSTRLHLDVQAYVTQEKQAELESQEIGICETAVETSVSTFRPMSIIVGMGSNIWFGTCLAVCIVGYGIIAGGIGSYFVTSFNEESDSRTPDWLRGAYVAISMMVAVIVFGGFTAAIWSMSSAKSNQLPKASKVGSEDMETLVPSRKQGLQANGGGSERLLQRHNTHYGARPNFPEIFEDASKVWEGSNVGVLVCGPLGLSASVAVQCRKWNYRNLIARKVAFHFHSLSFDL